jgi:hypothetical protein
MNLTLSELKAQNSAEEAKKEQLNADYEPAQNEPENLDNDLTDGASDNQESQEVDENQEQTEAWLSEENADGESNEVSAELKFSDKDIGAAKRKLQAKLQAEKDEVQRLKEEVERLKANVSVPVYQKTDGAVPTLEQYDYDQEAYAKAMRQWVLQNVQQASKAQEAAEKSEEEQKALERSVNEHYERAAKLVQKHGIEPDLYREAGLTLRRTVDQVFPGAGDLITDKILATLGEGSEKVEYHLGRSAQKREILKAKLLEDKNGLSAMAFLGRVLAEVNEPARKQTRAPAPAARPTGGSSISGSESGKDFAKKYNAEKDPQKRFQILRQAKSAGVDLLKNE